jgi:MFS family permease
VEPSGPLSTPAFRTLWAAGIISDAGDWLLLVALPIVVFDISGSALGTAGAFAAELGPGIVLAPLAGRLADALDRRVLMIAVSLLQALALLPLLLVGGSGGLVVVYAVIVAQASLAALFDPAKNALLPTLVDARQLVSANSLVGLGAAAGRLVGGPLGGLLLATGSLTAIVVADAMSFLAAAVLIATLPRGRGRGSRELRAGAGRAKLRVVMRSGRTRAALLVAFVAATAQGIFLVLFILFVARRLQGGSAEIGLLRGVQAIGAIVGGLLLTLYSVRWRPVALVAVAALAFGVVDLAIWNGPAITRSEAVYVALFVLAGAPGVIMEAGGISFLQEATADSERGRVFAAVGMVESAGQALGVFAAGALTAPLGLMAMLNAQGVLYLVSAALVVVFARGARPSRAAYRRKVDRRDGLASGGSAATGSSGR